MLSSFKRWIEVDMVVNEGHNGIGLPLLYFLLLPLLLKETRHIFHFNAKYDDNDAVTTKTKSIVSGAVTTIVFAPVCTTSECRSCSRRSCSREDMTYEDA